MRRPSRTVSVDPKQPVDEMRGARSHECLRAADSGRRRAGADRHVRRARPPTSVFSFHDEHRVEVVTGMNLPMLIKLATLREERRRSRSSRATSRTTVSRQHLGRERAAAGASRDAADA